MTEEIVKTKDSRVHLSDKFIRGLPIKDKQYSKGDDDVVGLRIYVFTGGSKVFWYNYTERNTKKKQKKIKSFLFFSMKKGTYLIHK